LDAERDGLAAFENDEALHCASGAGALGLTIPPSIFARADETID
jgi:hypothetical protein